MVESVGAFFRRFVVYVHFLLPFYFLACFTNADGWNRCEAQFVKVSDEQVIAELERAYSDYQLAVQPQGFAYHLYDQRKETAERKLPIGSKKEDFAGLNAKTWQNEERNFHLYNLGFRGFGSFAKRVNRELAIHFLHFQGEGVSVIYDRERVKSQKIVQRLRWAVHEAVINKYRQVKEYLTETDFWLLRALNKVSSNSDVLVLADGDSDPKLELGSALKPLVTLQISYVGNRNFFEPSLAAILDDMGLPRTFEEDLYPFEYRIKKREVWLYHSIFSARFDPRTTCEFTRYALLSAELPRKVHDRFVMEAFRLAESRGMKTVVASLDEATARLFKRYEFTDCEKLAVEQAVVQEYLCFAKLDSPEFKAALKRLSERTQGVLEVAQ